MNMVSNLLIYIHIYIYIKACQFFFILRIVKYFIIKLLTIADPCNGAPCLHGGTCTVDDSDGTPKAVCECLPEWEGEKCDNRKLLYIYI